MNAGRVSKITNNLQSYLSNDLKNITIHALRHVAKINKFSSTVCERKLAFAGNEIARLKPDVLAEIQTKFDVTYKSFDRYLKENAMPEQDSIYNAIYLWLNHEYPTEFKKQTIAFFTKSTSHSIFSLIELFGEGKEINLEFIQKLSGCYQLYRPSHLDPDRDVSIAKLIIGENAVEKDGNMCSCSYFSKFMENQEPEETIASGHFVSDGSSGAALLKTKHKKPMLFMIDKFAYSTSSSVLKGFGGIIMAGVTSDISAWPFWAIHTKDANFEPSTISYESTNIKNEDILSRLQRGSIRWEPKNFIGWPHKKD